MHANSTATVNGVETIKAQSRTDVLAWAFKVERVTGIEPALSAWEADVLPLNYTRRRCTGEPCSVRPDIVPDQIGCERAALRS